MPELYVENALFEQQNYTQLPLKKGEYDNCTFRDCSFTNSNLSDIRFSSCTFECCDKGTLSNTIYPTSFLRVGQPLGASKNYKI